MPKIIENVKQKLMDETRKQIMEFGYEAVTVRSVAKPLENLVYCKKLLLV